jgi:CMP-N-acetylneuraminic acid synthetase
MKACCFIPARGGSKGIPGKNKKVFCGKPLVQWSIDQAKESQLFDKIIVSSDDKDILKIARSCGVVADDRDPSLAQDETKLDDVMLEYFKRPKNECQYICLLQPTSPLRTAQDIINGHAAIKKNKWWSVVGVTWNPIMGWVRDATSRGSACLYLVGDRPNRQNRGNFFLENGAVYWVKFNTFLNVKNRVANPGKTYLLEMPPERSIELDSPFDWFLAEKAFEYRGAE